MRIVLDARKYFDFGIGTYIQNLVQNLYSLCSLGLIVSPQDRSKIDHYPSVELKENASGKYSLSELFSISSDVQQMNATIFHSPHYTVPLNIKVPIVTTIHDILHVRGKLYFPLQKRMYARVMVKHACSVSSAIIVDSEFTKTELLDEFNISSEKVHVIYLGVSKEYTKNVSEEEIRIFRNKYDLKKSFVLYTGGLKSHKNVLTLLQAFSQLLNRKEYQLVFSGESIRENKTIAEIIKKNNLLADVVDIGRVSRKELVIAYKEASVVVLPSLYEGFGFSVLEAMASGTPAIGARAASLPEVIGDAGILFDPYSSEELSTVLAKVLTDNDLRKSMIQRGYENVKKFTWEACAKNTFQLYQNIL